MRILPYTFVFRRKQYNFFDVQQYAQVLIIFHRIMRPCSSNSFSLDLLINSFLLTLLLIAQCAFAADSYVRDQIFVKLQTSGPFCNRLLNGTSTVGCQSNQNGNVGVLTPVKRAEDVRSAIAQLPLLINDLIALVDVADLESELVELLRTSERVQGIVLLDYGKRPDHFSEDAACPNQHFSFYTGEPSCHQWNAPNAVLPEGLRFSSFDKPIRYTNNRTEIELLIHKCAEPFNKDLRAPGLRCVGRMGMFMSGAGNTPLCLRRQAVGNGLGFGGKIENLCEPLEDKNVFVMLPPLSQKLNSSVRADQFVLAARMDTFSSIPSSRNGQVAALTSLIPLLSVANAIGEHLDAFLAKTQQTGRQLLLAFFHGESMGYIGSSRWVWDIIGDRFPDSDPASKHPDDNVRQMGLDAMSFFMELQQIGVGEQLFLHADNSTYHGNRTLVNQIVEAANSKSRVHFVDPTTIPCGAMPPSSYHSVLKATQHVPGMLLSSFGGEEGGHYNYSYLNSFLDKPVNRNDPKLFNLYVQRMTAVAEVALHSALTYVLKTNDTKQFGAKYQINGTYVRELAECFLQRQHWDCPRFMVLTNATQNPHILWRQTANDLFIGIGTHTSPIRRIVAALLIDSLGQKMPAMNVVSHQQCQDQNKKQNVYTFAWQNDRETGNGTCYRTSIYAGYARSPAFDIEDYDFSSGLYPTWSQSYDSGISVFEIYFKADYQLELYALLIAILVLMLSAPLNYGLKEQWFVDNSLPPASPQPL